MKKYFQLLYLLLLFMAACTPQATDTQDVVAVEAGDKEILAAQKMAQKEIDFFIESFRKNHVDSNYIYSIKTKFVERDDIEHMWVLVTAYQNGLFTGILGNAPVSIRSLEIDDSVTVALKDVEDWVFINKKEEIMVGGYTEKVLQQRQK
ncbi:MAG: DUF2314 domain-containing protein [Bacteroidetes bacterium]|nr:DUF2314 domain-containing protein [Bacteroidota bacterium]